MDRALQTARKGFNGLRERPQPCPASAVLPKTPRQTPCIPSIQPPNLTLPPSPPVFDPICLVEKDTGDNKTQLSRSLSSYSAMSYPSTSGHLNSRGPSSLSNLTGFSGTPSTPTIFSLLRAQRGSGSLKAPDAKTSSNREQLRIEDELQFEMTFDTTGACEQIDQKGSTGHSLHSALT
uniref:Uncharacterized protein n=1 Tax=Lotharella oceanica TaxID=641309 RepID=A0A7S2TGK8_9EUKA|mmetsp:Transcript_1054/g.1988  ORF Transcript_1054/g.1988 Transcript_1054/m.1988 type:complete len:178 (+) Transcript_1054:84-617(+)